MKKQIFVAKVKISQKEKEAILKVLDSGMIAQGPKVVEFEEKFAAFCGVRNGVAVSSGTAALHCALYAINLKPGDEVITVPFTFVATANCILMSGGKIVFTDIDEETFNISPEQIKNKITKKTKAIIAVDLYGQTYDYDAVKKIAKENGLFLIEDASQAVGAEDKGRKAGTLGDIGCFSFYATKNLMTGEGGMVVTNKKEYADRVRMFRHHGQTEDKRYEYLDLGYNYRMTDFVAALGIEQLKKIKKLNILRRKNAQYFMQNLKGIKGLILPKVKKGKRHVFHQFTIRVTPDFKMTRDEFASYLKEKGIFCGIYYPKPLHLHAHFQRLGYKKGDFPVSERMSDEVLSLPVHPYLTQSELKYIVKVIKSI